MFRLFTYDNNLTRFKWNLKIGIFSKVANDVKFEVFIIQYFFSVDKVGAWRSNMNVDINFKEVMLQQKASRISSDKERRQKNTKMVKPSTEPINNGFMPSSVFLSFDSKQFMSEKNQV